VTLLPCLSCYTHLMGEHIEPRGTIRPNFDWVRDLSAVPQHYHLRVKEPAVFIVAPMALKAREQYCPECYEQVKDSNNRGYYLASWSKPLVFHYSCSKHIGMWNRDLQYYAKREGVNRASA
jgi:hypothetical protein